MLKSQTDKPTLLSKEKKDLELSGNVLVDLLISVINKGAAFRFQAKGFSMYPFIRDGDIVTVCPLFGKSPNFGDVVAFVNPEPERLLVHRVIGKKGMSFLIKGDHVFDADGFIPKANILGYVTRVERKGNLVALGLGREQILIAYLTRSGFFLSSLLPIWRAIRAAIRR